MEGQYVKKAEAWIALQCAKDYYGEKLHCDISEMINGLVWVLDLYPNHGGGVRIQTACHEVFRQADEKH